VKPIYGADKLLPIKIFRQQYKTKYVTIDFTQATRKYKHRTNNAITPPAIRRAVIIHIHTIMARLHTATPADKHNLNCPLSDMAHILATVPFGSTFLPFIIDISY